MAKVYWFSFTPNPADSANLSPTFINFAKFDGTTLTPPGITQPFTGTGLYQFTYTPTFSIAFRIDGATTGGGLTTAIRYVIGALDPIDRVDELLAEAGSTLSALGLSNISLGTTNVAIGTSLTASGLTLFAIGTSNIALGTTNVAIGTSLSAQSATIYAIATSLAFVNLAIGSTASSYGDSVNDPGDLFGYLKRVREILEGAQTFAKSTGTWNMYARNYATLLATKTLSNSSTGVTRS